MRSKVKTTYGSFLYRGWKVCPACSAFIQKKAEACPFCKKRSDLKIRLTGQKDRDQILSLFIRQSKGNQI